MFANSLRQGMSPLIHSLMHTKTDSDTHKVSARLLAPLVSLSLHLLSPGNG